MSNLEKFGTNNPHGRPRGVPNRTTKDTRNLINQFLGNNWHTVQSDFDKLESKDRLAVVIKLLEFSVPKLKSTDLNMLTAQKIDQLTDSQIDALIDNLLNSDEDE